MDGRPIGGAAPLQAARPKTYTASGLIEKIGSDSITLYHGPVAALNWPSMTMRFRLADPAKARGFKAGDQIGRAHVWPPVTHAHLVCRLLLEKKHQNSCLQES